MSSSAAFFLLPFNVLYGGKVCWNLDDYEVQFKYWPKVQKVLALRREMGKTSNKKYTTMQKCVCKDSRDRKSTRLNSKSRI